MDTPIPKPNISNQRKFLFRDDQNQTIDVIIDVNNNMLTLNTDLSKSNLGNKKYSSFYSFDEMRKKNKFFFLCENIDDSLYQIENLISKNKNNLTFKKSQNQISIFIPTNINLAPKIIFELKENDENAIDYMDKDVIEKDLSAPDLDELNKNDFITPDNNYDKNLILFLKDKICNLEKQMSLLNLNFGILPEHYFDRIKDWIGGDKNKIRFNCIFKLGEQETNLDRYHLSVNLNCPQIFIFITGNSSIFGSYCPNYSIVDKNVHWENDPKAFLFSINLDKKYPAKKAEKNYFIAKCGYHFKDITFCSYDGRTGLLSKTGTYLDKLELEGINKNFYVKHFLVYKVEYI